MKKHAEDGNLQKMKKRGGVNLEKPQMREPKFSVQYFSYVSSESESQMSASDAKATLNKVFIQKGLVRVSKYNLK
jgi:hypothetical protein